MTTVKWTNRFVKFDFEQLNSSKMFCMFSIEWLYVLSRNVESVEGILQSERKKFQWFIMTKWRWGFTHIFSAHTERAWEDIAYWNNIIMKWILNRPVEFHWLHTANTPHTAVERPWKAEWTHRHTKNWFPANFGSNSRKLSRNNNDYND